CTFCATGDGCCWLPGQPKEEFVNVQWRQWKFWLLILSTVMGMAVTFSLGRWQLDRAAQKEALQSAMVSREQQPALEGHTLSGTLTPVQITELLHRAITLHGEWISEHTVYLDNRQMEGRQGFDVL